MQQISEKTHDGDRSPIFELRRANASQQDIHQHATHFWPDAIFIPAIYDHYDEIPN